jgi:hypothetical protein
MLEGIGEDTETSTLLHVVGLYGQRMNRLRSILNPKPEAMKRLVNMKQTVDFCSWWWSSLQLLARRLSACGLQASAGILLRSSAVALAISSSCAL